MRPEIQALQSGPACVAGPGPSSERFSTHRVLTPGVLDRVRGQRCTHLSRCRAGGSVRRPHNGFRFKSQLRTLASAESGPAPFQEEPQGANGDGIRVVTSLLANLTSISRAIGQERSEGTKKPDIVLDALKLLFSADAGSPSLSIVESSIIGMKDGSGDTSGSVLVQRALGATRELARLGAQGMPIDAEVLAAALVIEPVFCDRLSLAEVEERLGQEVSLLVHDAATVRRCPGRVDLYDAEASSALRELCLAFYDPRAVLMEFIFRLCSLRDADASAQHSDFQVEALEGLQIFSALGYSLGLPDMAGEMEELCFRALFPESMGETNAWLRADRASLESALAWAKSRISEICTADDGLQDLCAGFEIKSRTKSLISIMKKLLALHESGSRKSRSDLHDLLGVRVIVHPRTDMPADDAELLAEEACHRICSLVHAEWEPVEGRQKDYIRRPKDNGYQSLHTTVALPTQVVDLEVLSHQSPADDAAAAGAASQPPRVALEVQIRTAGMDARAEGGDAAHGAYKSGLSADAGRAVRELAQRRSAGEGVGAEGDDEALEEASAEGLFRSMDLDGNGVVSKDEVEALLSDVLGGSDRDRLREATLEVMRAVDADGDGHLTLDEFREFRKRIGISVSPVELMPQRSLFGAPKRQGEGGAANRSDSPAALGSAVATRSRSVPAADVRALGSSLRLAPAHARGAAVRAWAFLPGSGSDTLAPAGPSVGGQAGQPVFSRQRASDGSASAPSAPGGARAALGGSTGVPNEEESRTSSVGSVRDEGLEEAMPKVAGARRERKKRVKRASTPVTSRRGEGAGRGTDLLTRHIWGMRPGTRFRLEPVGTMSLAANVEPLSLWVPAVGPAVVGAVRASGSDIVVDVPFVSGVHARVEVVDRGGKLFLVVADLGSTNGTLVNRGRIRPHLDVTLRPGDILSLGDQDISFRVFAHSPSAEEIPEGDPALDAVLREASGSGESGDEEEEESGDEGEGESFAQLDTGRDSRSARELIEALRMDRRDVTALVSLAHKEKAQKRWSRARTLFRAASVELSAGASGQGDAATTCLASWAKMEMKLRHDTAARRLFRRAVEAGLSRNADGEVVHARSSTVVALHRWAYLEYKMLSCSALALDLLDEAEEISPRNPFVSQLQGVILRDLGRLDEGRECFQTALKSDSTNVSVLQAWGVLEARAGNLKDARKLFGAAVQAAGESGRVLNAWAVAEFRAMQMDAARVLFERALAASPGCCHTLTAWGCMEVEAQCVDRARELLGRALESDPDNMRALNAAGRLERICGDTVAARGLLERALSLYPDHVASLNELRMVEEQEGNVAEARRLLRQVNALNARAPQSSKTYNITRKMGQWRPGLAWKSIRRTRSEREEEGAGES